MFTILVLVFVRQRSHSFLHNLQYDRRNSAYSCLVYHSTANIIYLVFIEYVPFLNIFFQSIYALFIYITGKGCYSIVFVESFSHGVCVIAEVHHKCIFFVWPICTIETGKRLYALYSTQRTIHKHCMKQFLVKSGLKLFCYYQYLIVILLEFLCDVVVCHTIIIQVCLSTLSTVTIFYFARECHQRLYRPRVFFFYDPVYDLLVVSSRLT